MAVQVYAVSGNGQWYSTNSRALLSFRLRIESEHCCFSYLGARYSVRKAALSGSTDTSGVDMAGVTNAVGDVGLASTKWLKYG